MLNRTLNNRYKVVEKIAAGSTSVIYKAIDIKENKEVCLKFPKEALRTNAISSILRFTQQMKPILGIDNPYLVGIRDVFLLDNFPVVVSEYAAGVSMHQFLKTSAGFDVDKLVEIMLDILRGLEYLHSQNILHRDIKPSNIILQEKDGSFRARITDFGLSILINIVLLQQETEEICGTFSYMSPEQTGMLKRPLDHRSDIYSAGVLFYQLLTKRLPFVAEDIPTLIHKHIAAVPQEPSILNKTITPVLDRIILKMLAKDPEDRYQTEKGVISDLEKYLKLHREIKSAIDFEIAREDRLTYPTYHSRLVGREKEFHFLQSVIEDLKKGEGSIVFISGRAGSGKTRLANELRGYAYAKGAIFCSGKCYKTSYAMPYALVREALEDYIERIKRLPAEFKQKQIKQMKEALGELGQEIEKITPKIKELLGQQSALVPLESFKERIRFLITAGRFLNSLATKDNPVIMFFDDLQWADDSSVEVLRETAKNIAENSILFLITCREEEIGSQETVMKLVLELKEKQIPHHFVSVADLTQEETNEVIAEMLSEKIETVRPLAQEIHARARGNAFFITELLHALINNAVVYFKDGHYLYDLKKMETISLPDNVIDILLSRIETLAPQTTQVLSYAAVIGKRFTMEDVLGIISYIEPQQVLDSIEEATDKQFLTRTYAAQEEILFVHDRVREAFYRKVPETERVELNKKIAFSLEDRHKENPVPVIFDLAYHFHEAGIEDKTLPYSLQAAHKALKAYANTQAINLYLIARKILEKWNQSDSPEYIAVLENLGEAYRLAGRFDESLEVLRLCESSIPRQERIHHAEIFSKISDTLWEKGDVEKCVESLERGLEILDIRIPKNKTGILLGLIKEFPIQLLHMVFYRILVKKKYCESQVDNAIAGLFLRLAYACFFLADARKMFYLYLRGLNFTEKRIGPGYKLMHYYRQSPGPYGTTTLPWFWRGYRDVKLALNIAQNIIKDKVQEGRVCGYVSISLLSLNRPIEGLGYAQKAITLVKGAGEYWELGIAYVFRDLCNFVSGRIRQAIAENEEYVKIMETAGVLQSLGWALMMKGKLFSLIGDVNNEVIHVLKRSVNLASQTRDKFDETGAWAILAFAHLRRGEHQQAQECISTFRDYFYRYGMGFWFIDAFSMGAEVYLEKLKNSQDLSPQERATTLSHLRWFCSRALFWGRICRAYLGWAYQVNATYAWLTGRKKRAVKLWEKGIKFLRQHTADKYRLAAILLEEARFIIDEPDEELRAKARKYIGEAKQLFVEQGVRQDLRIANNLLGAKENPETPDEQGIATTIAEQERTVSLLEISRLISSILELDVLLEKILELSVRTLGAERGYLLLYNDTGRLDCVFSLPGGAEEKQLDFSKMKLSRTVVAAIEQSHQGMVYPAIKSQKQTIEDTESIKIFGKRSIVCAPLIAKDSLLGMIYLDNHLAEGVFEKRDLDALTTICTQAAISIENARLFKESREKARLEQEMATARHIQQSLLPNFSPKVGDLRVEGLMLPAKEVAGDLYDFIPYGPDKVGIAVADVSGKGLDSGMVMSMTKSAVYTLSRQQLSPRELVVSLNKILCAQLYRQKFISFIYAEYTAQDNSFTWGGGGHEYVLVWRACGDVELIKTGGLVLGMFPDIDNKIPQESLKLNKGDRVILYTDGVTEARNPKGEMFTLERLIEIIKSSPANLSIKELLQYLKDKLQEFTSGAPLWDDITLVVLGRE